ncbi:MAG: NADH-quinone oxidoreductase subunit L [Omnitrophica bacterium RIFCSPHIGHO2_02_FULL_46_11]|nr:MAG: NADH-quinone oxidoreductase subunit L [Omnitrophica bacterium RIFCSPLOWO2_01_FULL_45_10b]OGW87852.1 MAG: NADH-quinone oxidoreductase subunit L [Omnitrophica bacterium RIFCSPHIGHO2_02_FULL_46_11]
MIHIAWWILFFPLISFAIIPFIPEAKRIFAGWIACVGIFFSFLITLRFARPMFDAGEFHTWYSKINWILIPGLQLELGFFIDSLAILMLLVVTGVGTAIFYYSLEYMEHDEGYKRYFAGLSLFAFSMIGIVISGNLLQLFIFWELVGLSSYLLIGHWYQKDEAADAGKKAFLTNRIGDFGFLIGILLLWTFSGPAGSRTLNFLQLNASISSFVQSSPAHATGLTIAMLLIFCGVLGKSAQFPLHVWLPDAMEGPTPVSALIHAATMVAAGVYLLARMFSLFLLSPVALEIIAYIGGFTALFAATQAIVQKDIKRVLAYSTLSQLGYMVMAIGLGSAAVGMYHLTTHAFFKALLFLGAGSIIHATEKQNIFEMGGVIKKMPFTSAAFLIGTFALIGFWPSSGFFSKDKILALAFSENRLLFISSAITVFLTALYMGRAISLMFFGASKIRKKLHEPSQKILMPLLILSILSLAGGFFGFERFLHDPNHHEMSGPNSLVIQLATVLGLAGVFSGFFFYRIGEKNRKSLLQPFSWAYEILMRKYFMDDLYDFLIRYIQQPFAKLLDWFERTIIVEGAVNHAASFTALTGRYFKKLQTGRIQTYLSVFFSGVVIAIYLIRFGALH